MAAYLVGLDLVERYRSVGRAPDSGIGQPMPAYATAVAYQQVWGQACSCSLRPTNWRVDWELG